MSNPIEGYKKVGEAKLEIFFLDIYRSELYTQTGDYQPNEFPQALKIHYLRNIKAIDLVDRTEQEWQKLGVSQDDIDSWISKLKPIWPDIRKNNELLLVVNEVGQSHFYFDNKPIGSIADSSFGPNFLRIWLDEKSSYPDLRKQLIGASK
ncbi:chalcone isomerase family protein [Aliiglaciecola sp. LCG003]|uniref:chalcone isomerase family protein n=1 Tax=Aliiglaciecola sp. LCG003 TaxID=3053655 RepID=UPI0025736184|nr:chalcone isomerase family protein [Aliiglaciecola sp. LCG003]WJG09955.1 chalcone isomerase family protein [Aliiglaciecola sp. LCG003]